MSEPDAFLELYGDKVDGDAAVLWRDCPVLTGLDAGTYSTALDIDTDQSGQDLSVRLHRAAPEGGRPHPVRHPDRPLIFPLPAGGELRFPALISSFLPRREAVLPAGLFLRQSPGCAANLFRCADFSGFSCEIGCTFLDLVL